MRSQTIICQGLLETASLFQITMFIPYSRFFFLFLRYRDHFIRWIDEKHTKERLNENTQIKRNEKDIL